MAVIRTLNQISSEPDLTRVASPAHLSLDQNVAKVLREAILNGDLAPDVRLRQEQLARHFQVSRIPIREALQQLESEGLIAMEPRRGARVSALTAGAIRELFEMRIALERLLMEKAVPHLDERRLREAREVLRKMDNVKASRVWVQLNEAFHEGLYVAATRPMILDQVHKLRNNVKRYLRLNLATYQKHRLAAEEHGAILDACEARDAILAGDLIARHLSRVSDQLESLLLKDEAHETVPFNLPEGG
jgi:DNA-binding GntR family transcriptional regulator